MINPTADAAKLLPCPFCRATMQLNNQLTGSREWSVWGEHDPACPMSPYAHWHPTAAIAVSWWNTRPQPAPPAGEPVAWAVKDFADGWIIYAHEVHARRQAELTGARIERLGLSTRPKVEDAEVAVAIKHLRNRSEFLNYGNGDVRDEVPRELIAIADLLERLAASRHHWKCECNTAESKLAEREAELAKADEVIWHRDRQADGLTMLAPNERNIERNESAAINRHAARQQQKASAEQTESKAGETR